MLSHIQSHPGAHGAHVAHEPQVGQAWFKIKFELWSTEMKKKKVFAVFEGFIG